MTGDLMGTWTETRRERDDATQRATALRRYCRVLLAMRRELLAGDTVSRVTLLREELARKRLDRLGERL